jgi:hypothetical protein
MGKQQPSASKMLLEPVLDVGVIVQPRHFEIAEPRVHGTSLHEIATHI